MDQKLALVAKLRQPAGHVGRLIRDNSVRDPSFRTKVSTSHLRDQFLFGIYGGTKSGGLADALASKSLLMPY
jgi:hypothetical protein